MDRSFFLTLLERKGVHIAAGPQAYLPATLGVAALLRPARAVDEQRCWEMIEAGTYVDGTATLEMLLPVLEAAGGDYVPVVNLRGAGEAPELLGAVFHVDALRAYSQALAAAAREEHS